MQHALPIFIWGKSSHGQSAKEKLKVGSMSFCRSIEDKLAFIQNLYKWSTKQGDSLSHLSAKNRVQQQHHLCLCKWSLACSQTENVRMYFKLSQLYPELSPGSAWAEQVRKEGTGNWQQRAVTFCQALCMVLMWLSCLLKKTSTRKGLSSTRMSFFQDPWKTSQKIQKTFQFLIQTIVNFQEIN